MRWILRLAFVGAAYSAGIVGWLLLPGDRPVPMLMWSVAFVGLFPVFGSALLVARRYWREGMGTGTPTLWRPGAVVVGVLATLAALVVAGLVLTAVAPAPPVPPGAPEVVDGRYVLNNHGSLTPVSRRVYLRVLEAWQLGFVSIAFLFYLVAALVVGATGERLAARGARFGVGQV